MEELLKLEKEIIQIYQKVVIPVADDYGFQLPNRKTDAPGQPRILLLGNHSSGKSSFINSILGREVQKTGLAPIDDGFTFITYGEKQDQFDGQTLITHPELACSSLEEFGPAFVSRLRLKTEPHELLKEISLVDSPGMIDAVKGDQPRGYDFPASVRYFAETSDLILFFFDPEKPGTTGETVSIFTETLAGLEHKLLIILNKADLFETIRDFARTYGALCWNLSKAIRTKDIPHIYNLYLPESKQNDHKSIPLDDFDESREEVLQEIRRAPLRRFDNLISDLHKTCKRLAMFANICRQISEDYFKIRVRTWGAVGIVAILTLVATYLTRSAIEWTTPLYVFLGGAAGIAATWGIGRWLRNRFLRRCHDLNYLEAVFFRVYHDELNVRNRPDLRALWETLREGVSRTIKTLGPERLPRSFGAKRQIRRLLDIADEKAPALRRSVSEFHKRNHEG